MVHTRKEKLFKPTSCIEPQIGNQLIRGAKATLQIDSLQQIPIIHLNFMMNICSTQRGCCYIGLILCADRFVRQGSSRTAVNWQRKRRVDVAFAQQQHGDGMGGGSDPSRQRSVSTTIQTVKPGRHHGLWAWAGPQE